MKTISINVYELHELSEKAKEKARAWYREGQFNYEWWDSTYEDAANIGLKLTSFDLDRNRHACGHFTMPAAHVAEKIMADHGKDCSTFKTAAAFVAECKALESNPPEDEDEWNDKQDAQDEVFLKALLEDYSRMLQDESDYMSTDEQVDENITANGYTFTESGKREG